jgi:glutamate synthase (NADPH/NADH) small chain
MAFGFRPSPPDWLKQNNISVNDRQLIEAPAGSQFPYQTTNEKVFAGGDAVRGSDLVVTAIAEGRTAAESILDFLGV